MDLDCSKRPAVRARSRVVSLLAIIGLLSAAAFAQNSTFNRSRSFGPDACGPADPAYLRLSSETGGIPLFLQRSEASKAFHLVRESTRNNVATVFWATGALNSQARTIDIPVDASTRRLTFAFSTNNKGDTLVVRAPAGDVITSQTAGTEITELNCGRILTVAPPAPGVWHAAIAGTGTFWMSVQAQSDIHFIKAEFVQPGGRPGHEGWFRIAGQPVAGVPATLQISLPGAAQHPRFHLVNELGEPIQTVHMSTQDAGEDIVDFVGTVDLPAVPFRVAVVGRDADGHPYQRFFSTLFHAETVEVTAPASFDEVAAGTSKPLIITVRNVGPARIFKLTVTDAHRFVARVLPAQLQLGTGEARIVRVDLMVPAESVVGTGDDVVVVASSTSGPTTTNSSIVHVSVIGQDAR